MFRGGKLRQRTVIDINTAERVGYVSDVEIDEGTGCISGLIIRRKGTFCGMLGIGELSVPWSAIAALSSEFVLIRAIAIPAGAREKP